LAEYDLIEVPGIEALSLARQYFVNLPFIFVSHLEAAEVELEALQRGATDFVLKQRLGRLPFAIDHALKMHRHFRKCHIYNRSNKFAAGKSFADRTIVDIAYTDLQGNIAGSNHKLFDLPAHASAELLSHNFQDIIPTNGIEKVGKIAIQKRYNRSNDSLRLVNPPSSKLNNSDREFHKGIFLEGISKLKQAEVDLQKYEADLQKTEQLLAGILKTAIDGIMYFQSVRDDRGEIVDFEWVLVNPAAAAITGKTPEQLIGKRLLVEMPGNLESGLFEQYVQVVETGEVFENEFYYNHENIAAWFCDFSAKLGDGFVVTFRDITARKATEEELLKIKNDLERRIHRRTAELNIANRLLHNEVRERERIEEILVQSESHLRLALTAADMGTWEWDIITDQMSYSTQAEKILGLEPNSFAGSCVASLEIIHPEDRQLAYEKKRESVQHGIPYKMEERIIKSDGEIHWVEVQGDVVYGMTGEPIRMIGVIADITDRKQAEMEVLRTLEKERELNELKSRFVSMVSHEFRNPLAVILSAAETLEKYEAKLSPERKQKRFEHIKASCEDMNSLLEDVLVLARAESGKFIFEPACLNLKNFCYEMIEKTKMAQMSAQRQDLANMIKLVYATAYEEVRLDKKLLHHILLNLLSNAVKYSPQGGIIEFAVESSLDQLIFKIKDQGIGIPDSDLPRLFESFHRATNVKNIAGTGLGLSIVKRALDLHGGKIAVMSKESEGTTFTVSIPITKCQAR
jgi:PAS domain S-box-containing protein